MIVFLATHITIALLLLISHSLFLFRGFHLLHTRKTPRTVDRISRFSAQLTLTLTVVTGLTLFVKKNVAFFPHGMVGLIALCLIPATRLARTIIKQKRSLPWILPSVNFFLIVLAMITGFIFFVTGG